MPTTFFMILQLLAHAGNRVPLNRWRPFGGMAGIQFPANEKGDRSTTSFNKEVFSAMANSLGAKDLEDKIKSEKDWRHKYSVHLDQIVERTLKLQDASVLSTVLTKGLEKARSMDFEPSGSVALPLSQAMAASAAMLGAMQFEANSGGRPSIHGQTSREGSLLPVSWRCWTCHHDVFVWSFDDWMCDQCGSRDYYDAAASLRRETEDGVWLFMPRRGNNESYGLDTQADCSAEHGASNNNRSGISGAPWWSADHGPPYNDPGHEGREQAESETVTNDPVVDPDEPLHRRRRNRRSRRSRRSQGSEQQVQDVLEDPMLPADALLAQRPQDDADDSDVARAIAKVSKSSSTSWNSRLGPEKGVKYRSGMPPQPPAWRYNREDLRSFVKWERKLSIWQLQIQSYMNRRDAALMLFTSLSGEAEEELENCDLTKVNSSTGIEYIQEQLRLGLQTKLVYQKRKLLADHESIVRQGNESIRAFANRYRRTERALASVGVSVHAMYDDESRGNRLLERARLSPENQRLALIGSRYNLTFDAILESLCMSFPEHKQPPPLFGKDGTPIRTMGKTSSFSPSTSTPSLSSTSTASTYRSDKGKGKFRPKQAYATEAQDLETVNENEEFQGDDEQCDDDDDDENQDGEDAGEADDDVLTVTAKKLQSLTLGRKFSGNGNVADRKKNTHCAACGELGHWAGDAVCSKSAKGGGKSKSKGSNTSTSDSAKNVQSKKVLFTLSHDDGVQHHLPKEPEDTPPFLTFMMMFSENNAVSHDVMFMGGSLAGLMVLDTACQRMVCGRDWMNHHAENLAHYRLHPHSVPTAEAFQFGRGQPITARSRVYFPSVIGDVNLLLGASVVDTAIPLLASNTLLETLDTVIDLGKQKVFFRKIGVEVDIIKIQGHLAVSISSFNDESHRLPIWKTLSHQRFWKQPHPEIILPGLTDLEPMKAQRPPSGVFAVEDATSASTSMAEAMACAAEHDLESRAGGAAGYEQHGEIGFGSKDLVDTFGPRGPSSSTRSTAATEEGAPDVTGRLPTPRVEAVRQHSRVLCPVRAVPSSDKMECHTKEVGSNWKAIFSKVFFACAILLKYLAGTSEIHYQQSQSEAPIIFSDAFEQQYESTIGGWGTTSGGHPRGRPDLRRASTSSIPPPTWTTGGLREEVAGDHRGWQESHCGAGEQESHDGIGGGHGIRGDGQSTGTVGLGGARRLPMMEPGHKKQLLGKLKKSKHAMESEIKLYVGLATTHRMKRSRVDILETFAGNAPVSSRASQFGLIAATPMDYNTGFDLSTTDGQHQCKRMVDHLKPLVLVQSLHCTPWALLQDNCNYVDRPEELEMRRAQERPTVKAAMDRCQDQHDGGRFYT
eukprot:s670_g25.t1